MPLLKAKIVKFVPSFKSDLPGMPGLPLSSFLQDIELIAKHAINSRAYLNGFVYIIDFF
jgi:hypothetical protein